MTPPKPLALPPEIRRQVEAIAGGNAYGLRVLRHRGVLYFVFRPNPAQHGYTLTAAVSGWRILHLLFVASVALVRGCLPGGRGR